MFLRDHFTAPWPLSVLISDSKAPDVHAENGFCLWLAGNHKVSWFSTSNCESFFCRKPAEKLRFAHLHQQLELKPVLSMEATIANHQSYPGDFYGPVTHSVLQCFLRCC